MKEFDLEIIEKIATWQKSEVTVKANSREEAEELVFKNGTRELVNGPVEVNDSEIMNEASRVLTEKENFALEAVDHVMHGIPESDYKNDEYATQEIIENHGKV